MNQQNMPNPLILFLLGAPLLGVALVIGILVVISESSDSDTTNTDQVVLEREPLADAAQISALATVNAAPPHPAKAANVSGAETVELAAALGYTPEIITAGERNFLGVCSACHGVNGRGISGLGKTLINSEFVQTQTDQELLDFVIVGRKPWDPANTTGVEMPVRGGNPGLTDQDILSIIAYIRIVDGGVAPDGNVVAAAPATESAPAEDLPPAEYEPIDVSAFLASRGVEFEAVEPRPLLDPLEEGRQNYERACAMCHGQDGAGVENLGGNLLTSELVTERNGVMLQRVIDYGIPVWSDANESGVHMPERGGYPQLSIDEINHVMAYLYSLVEN